MRLLYGSETWTPYARQEHRLQTFHLRNLRFILSIKWQEKKTNVEVLKLTSLLSIYTLIRQRRMRWLGHIHRMDDGRIPKDLLYGELREGVRGTGRPLLRYKDVCKRDLKALDINESSWETSAADRDEWRRTLKHGCRRGSAIGLLELLRSELGEGKLPMQMRILRPRLLSSVLDVAEIARLVLDF